MEKMCAVCEYPFRDGDKLVAVMVSEYKQIDSDVHYAITQPGECLEIMHYECYDFPSGKDHRQFSELDS